MISLLPGPVEIPDAVRRAYQLPPLSHRSREFIELFERLRARLRAMTGAAQAALMAGSGTLANDAVGAQLDGRGLVLVNGEFGQRLAIQARRWRHDFKTLEWPWGEPWNLDEVHDALDHVDWVWAVHLETSTGMLNDITKLGAVVREHGAKLALDCVSSLGAVPIDLRAVWLASGVSGKALASYAGVAIVFASQGALRQRDVPTSLDAHAAAEEIGPRFTFPSPPVLALERALDMAFDYTALGCLVRRRLRALGWKPMVEEGCAAPVVTTFSAPCEDFLDRCRELGYEVGGESRYLAERGLVQIATMGAVSEAHVNGLFDNLA